MPNKNELLEQYDYHVWDPILRSFHWLLVAAFFVSWWSEGRDLRIHIISGTLIAGLLLFRLIWGFVGQRHARFASFYPTTAAILQHSRELLHFKSGEYIAHTPIGSLMIFILLAVLIILSGTGMALIGLQIGLGVFASWSSASFESEILIQTIHLWCFNVLQLLIAIHLAGVVIESLLQRRNLVMAMIHGKKTIKEQHS
ncbi:cytochrome b/b6 domain-containing protein [Mariprofundus ferrooxydans]|nr:cytochrome b/b6 domain-containing protein [Mariprofundus ferrooxydans]